jgi:uncharacterized protein YodC (DUF2158 family)
MNEFKTGDTVVLKSGGPLMTVQWIGEYMGAPNMVSCTWFDDKKVRKTEVFDPDILMIEDCAG